MFHTTLTSPRGVQITHTRTHIAYEPDGSAIVTCTLLDASELRLRFAFDPTTNRPGLAVAEPCTVDELAALPGVKIPPPVYRQPALL